MRVLRTTGALLALAFLISCARHESPRAAGYNILLITVDTARADHIGAYGFKSAETPVLDQLAAKGIRFEHAASPVPLTLPAHASILSGTLPQHHGARDNGGSTFPQSRETLATVFTAAGYRTAAFVGSFVLDHRFGLARGFDLYDDDIRRDPNATSSFDAERPAGAVVDRALDWLNQPGTKPFFAWIHLYDAHAPYEPPEPFRSRHSASPYDGELAYVDSQIGRLVQELERRDLTRHTIIVVVGDHGESLGEHGELTHGLLLYEPTLHVPMIMACPGTLAARVIAQPVSAVDLAPTLAALAGTHFPASSITDGHDLSAALLSTADVAAEDLYSETEYPAIFGWSALAALRRGQFKFIASPAPELYDLAADPHETKNLLDSQRRTYRDLASALEKLKVTAVPPKTSTPIDAETRAKLASLGYVAPTAGGGTTTGPRPDPKAMAPLFHQFEEANWASNEGRPAEAIAKLRAVTKADAANGVFLGSLARALRAAGQLKEAIPIYRQVTAMNPTDPETWYNLAVALQEAGETREAGQAIREAIRRDDKRPELHNALGIALSAEGNPAAAEQEFQRAATIDPHDGRAFNNLGNIYRDTGRFDEATAAYRHALELVPRYADALNGLGVLEVQRDHPAAALPLFDQALATAPHFYEAQINRGIALQLLGNRGGAAEQFRKTLAELPPGSQFDGSRKAAGSLLRNLSHSGN